MTIDQEARLSVLSRSSIFTINQLQDAAIEYGLFFLDIFIEEASRLNISPLAVAQSLNAARKKS